MKKFILLLMAVVVVSVYSCQKDNQVAPKKSIKGSLSFKKDTVPPGVIKFAPSIIKKDTVPPGK
jgi:hypothetical protein